ncbi:hypothetical protein AB0C15_29755 [Micromonospora sp. NPDC048835]|uniref:hypothetical protein n=1 Tax=Micromonospora sp. NPDC048835 TaxID=3155147 RepID=UPI0033FE557B
MSTDGDAGLAGLLQQVVADSLTWLGEYPQDRVDARALTAFRRSLDWLSQQLQVRQAGQLASGGREETALKVAAELFVDLSWWLSTCPDEEVELDVAVSVLENSATFTYELSGDQRQRLVQVFGELAAAERHEGRRHAIRQLPFAIGLVDGAEPEGDMPVARDWVRPEDRANDQAKI